MISPLDLHGPEFLAFYVLVLVGGIALAAALRLYLRQPGGEPGADSLNLSPYAVAYLSGGSDRACDAAIARLVQEKALEPEPSTRMVRVCGALPAGTSDIESAVYRSVGLAAGMDDAAVKRLLLLTGGKGTEQKHVGVRVSTVKSSFRHALKPIHNGLVSTGLVVTAAQGLSARLLPTLIVLCVLALGIAKIFVGLERNRPIGFLFMLCLLTTAIAFGFSKMPAFRSRRGDRALAKLKQSNAALRHCLSRRHDFLSNQDFVLALGLFGIGVLAGSPLADLAIALSPPPPNSSSSGGSSCGSSCGGGCGGGCGGCGG